jgi:Apea-like HEPN
MGEEESESGEASAQPLRIVVPLLNLRTDWVVEERLISGLTLGPFRTEEKRVLGEELAGPYMGDYATQEALDLSEWAITLDADHENWGAGPWIEAAVQSFVRALRLLHPGDVTAPLGMCMDSVSGGITSMWGDLSRTVKRGVSLYVLRARDLAVLGDLTATLGRDVVRTSLAIAISRFEQSYYRMSSEDQFIDLAIALESSVLYGLKDELVYRLGLRGAALLAHTEDPEAVFTFLKILYTARSQVVHEGHSIAHLIEHGEVARLLRRADYALDEVQFLGAFQDIVRQLLREYVRRLSELSSTDDGKPMERVHQALDAQILKTLARQMT